ncbi:MAG: septal ring lytic transglycosylase RlpA family protein, partial [Patescibacteria group bacterium]
MLKKVLVIFIFCCLCFGFSYVLAESNEPWAQREWKLFIDEATILKGYTVVAGDNEFKLGVVDKAISQAATAVLRELSEGWAPDGPVVDQYGNELNYKRVSTAWEFDFLGDPRIGVLNKPLYVAIKNSELKDVDGNTDMHRKQMFFWDGGSKKWKPLPGSNDLENNLTRAVIHLPYAILAVFQHTDQFEAWTSWYGDALTPSSPYNCASNNHEIGSYIKVCRLDNLQKCVKVKVVSTGPYVDNRIVDLTKTAFRSIGNPG